MLLEINCWEFHTIESVIRRMQGTPILLAARHFLVRKFPTFTFRFPSNVKNTLQLFTFSISLTP